MAAGGKDNLGGGEQDEKHEDIQETGTGEHPTKQVIGAVTDTGKNVVQPGGGLFTDKDQPIDSILPTPHDHPDEHDQSLFDILGDLKNLPKNLGDTGHNGTPNDKGTSGTKPPSLLDDDQDDPTIKIERPTGNNPGKPGVNVKSGESDDPNDTIIKIKPNPGKTPDESDITVNPVPGKDKPILEEESINQIPGTGSPKRFDFLETSDSDGETEESEPKRSVFTITEDRVTSITYNTICDREAMINIKKLTLLKMYYNFEQHMSNPLMAMTWEIKEEIEKYRDAVFDFAQALDEQIPQVVKFPANYMAAKIKIMLAKVFKVIDPYYIEVNPKLDGGPGIPVNLKDVAQNSVRVQLQVKPFTFNYLVQTKKQIEINRSEPAFGVVIPRFLKELPDVLVSILNFLVTNYNPEQDLSNFSYIINFFTVFGSLLPKEELYGIILNTLAHQKTEFPFKPEGHPDLLRRLSIYTEVPDMLTSPFRKILKVDRVFFHEDDDLLNAANIYSVYSRDYTFHPTWARFFDIKSKKGGDGPHPFKDGRVLIPLEHSDPVVLEDLIFKGHKYLYYFYVHLRKEGPISHREDSLENMAELIYKELLTTTCYQTEKLCDLALLIPKSEFTRYFLIMLALLKPFTKQHKDFSTDDIELLVEKAKALGYEPFETFVSVITPFFPNYRAKTNLQKAATIESELHDIADTLHQANLENKPNVTPYQVKKNRRQAVGRHLENAEQRLNSMFPELKTTPKEPKQIQDYVNGLAAITNTMEESRTGLNQLLANVIVKKIHDMEDEDAKRTDKELMFIQSVKKVQDLVENEDEDAKPTDKELVFIPRNLPTYAPNKEITNIKSSVNQWTLKQIFKRINLPDNHGFVRYLDYTMAVRAQLVANNINADFFSDDQYNNVRRYDLYVFNYCVKKRLLANDSVRLRELQNDFKTSENIDMVEMESNTAIFESMHVFDFMPEFFHLFSLFESRHDVGVKGEIHHDARHASVFHEIYKFLIELRLRLDMDSEDAHPRVVAHRELLRCMIDHHRRIRDDIVVPEDPFEPTDKSNQPLYDREFSEWESLRRCKQPYSDLSRFYYFLFIDAANDHPEVYTLHDQFFANHFIVNTQELYSYLIHSSNWFSGRFLAHCDKKFDSVCFGLEVFEKIHLELNSSKNTGYNDRQRTAEILNEKLVDLKQVPAGYMHTVRVTLWNTLCSLHSKDHLEVNSYNLFLNILHAQQIKLTDRELVLSPSDEAGIEQLALFNALRLRVYSPHDANAKIRAGVDAYMRVKTIADHGLLRNKVFSLAGAKFLIKHSTTFEAAKEIIRVMVKADKVMDMTLWWPTHSDDVESKSLLDLALSKDMTALVRGIAKMIRNGQAPVANSQTNVPVVQSMTKDKTKVVIQQFKAVEVTTEDKKDNTLDVSTSTSDSSFNSRSGVTSDSSFNSRSGVTSESIVIPGSNFISESSVIPESGFTLESTAISESSFTSESPAILESSFTQEFTSTLVSTEFFDPLQTIRKPFPKKRAKNTFENTERLVYSGYEARELQKTDVTNTVASIVEHKNPGVVGKLVLVVKKDSNNDELYTNFITQVDCLQRLIKNSNPQEKNPQQQTKLLDQRILV